MQNHSASTARSKDSVAALQSLGFEVVDQGLIFEMEIGEDPVVLRRGRRHWDLWLAHMDVVVMVATVTSHEPLDAAVNLTRLANDAATNVGLRATSPWLQCGAVMVVLHVDQLDESLGTLVKNFRYEGDRRIVTVGIRGPSSHAISPGRIWGGWLFEKLQALTELALLGEVGAKEPFRNGPVILLMVFIFSMAAQVLLLIW